MFKIIWDKAKNNELKVKEATCIEAVNALMQKRKNASIGFMDTPFDTKIIERVKKTAEWVKNNADTFVVLGIGGSSLGGKTLISSLCNNFSKDGVKVMFLDNVDPDYFMEAINSLNLSRTVFNAISKSGSTAETMAQFLIIYELLCKKLGKKEAVSRIILTTDPEKGALRPLEKSFGFKTLEVPQNVGGRFSVLTDVGLLPACVAGIDVEAIMQGAAEVSVMMDKTDLEQNLVAKYSLLKYNYALSGKDVSVMMPYSSKLFDFSAWYVQLWAESLGKKGLGQTAVPAIGATDQHSQVQLFMEGPKNKFVTFIGIEKNTIELKIPEFEIDVEAFSYLSGHTMNELLRAELLSTERALFENNVPSVRIELDKLDAKNLGRLFMFFEGAVAITGELMKIDAFDQPGVELGKNYTYKMMGRRGY